MRGIPCLCALLIVAACADQKQHGLDADNRVVAVASSITAYATSPEEKLALAKKADAGDGESALKLAQAWEMGDRSIGQAVYWYYRAALAGNVTAQYSLGHIYYSEPHVGTKDMGLFWMKKAAAAGDKDAALWLKTHEQSRGKAR